MEALRGSPGSDPKLTRGIFRDSGQLAHRGDYFMALFVANHLSKPGTASGPWSDFLHVYLQDNLPKSSPGPGNKTPSGLAARHSQRPRPIGSSQRTSAQQHRTKYATARSPLNGRQSPHYHRTSPNTRTFRRRPFSERKDDSPCLHQSRRLVRSLRPAGTPKVYRLVLPFPADLAKRNGQAIGQRPERNLLRMGALERLRFP